MKGLLLVGVSAGLLLAGCAGSGSATPPGATPPSVSPPSVSPSPSLPVVPLPPDAVVFQVRSDGTYVSQMMRALTVPVLTIHGDGTVYRTVTDGYDIPPRVHVGHTDPMAVASFVAAVAADGILDSGDFGSPGATDLPNTTVRLSGAGGEVSATAYGLEWADVPGPGLTEDQARLRVRLRSVIDTASALAPGDLEWVPDRVRVLKVPYGNEPHGSDPGWPGPDIAQAVGVPWWTDGCLGVSDGAAELYAAALANPGGTWRTDYGPLTLAVVPVLPGEPIC